jgi:hypothetical protein
VRRIAYRALIWIGKATTSIPVLTERFDQGHLYRRAKGAPETRLVTLQKQVIQVRRHLSQNPPVDSPKMYRLFLNRYLVTGQNLN